MKTLPVILAVMASVARAGWLSDDPPVAAQPLAPIQVRCDLAARIAGDLERIIAQPNRASSDWDATLSQLYGTATADQRRRSAKTLLWTVRTQCPGF